MNLAQVRQIPLKGKLESTGIFKHPVQGRVRAQGNSLEGDTQVDRRYHGGRQKAVYAYSIEDYQWWAGQLGAALAPGTFGENLTLEGVVVNHALIGERWRIGSAEFEVTQPRQPCWKLGVKMQDPKFPRKFSLAGRAGAYLSIESAGDLGAGDQITILHRPDHPVTLGLIARLNYHDPQLAQLVKELLDQGLSGAEWDQVLGDQLSGLNEDK